MMQLYHGTTHRFDKFDTSIGNSNNHVGIGIYLTSSERDALNNYACVGPDLRSRIAERQNDIYMENKDKDISYEAAREMACKELDGKNNRLLKCEIKPEAKLLTLGNHYLEMWECGPEEDDEPQYSDIANVLCEVAGDNGYDIAIVEPEMTTFDIFRVMRCAWNGQDMPFGEVFKLFVIAAGYDGIEYEDAYDFFPGMVAPGTKHYVLYNDVVEIKEVKELAV